MGGRENLLPAHQSVFKPQTMGGIEMSAYERNINFRGLTDTVLIDHNPGFSSVILTPIKEGNVVILSEDDKFFFEEFVEICHRDEFPEIW